MNPRRRRHRRRVRRLRKLLAMVRTYAWAEISLGPDGLKLRVPMGPLGYRGWNRTHRQHLRQVRLGRVT